MQSALHITSTVLPGNKLEVELSPGSEGQEVTVFVLLPNQKMASSNKFADLAVMAADREIQRALVEIDREFEIAEADGLA